MKELQLKEMRKLITFLEAIQCQYKIITTDGEEFGSLEVVNHKEPRRKRNFTFPYGTIAAHYKPFIDLQAKVGEVLEIPIGEFNADVLRGAICSYLTRNWGTKTYTTMISETSIQVMKTEESK